MTSGYAAMFALNPDQAAELLADWRQRAACRGRGMLMDPPPEERTDELTLKAKRVCWQECPVRPECLTWVLNQPDRLDVGWVCGGLTEDERSTKRRSSTTARTARERRPVGPPGTRWCYRCRTFKDPADFYSESRTADGLSYRCKGCQNEINIVAQRNRRARLRQERDAQRSARVP